MEIYLGHSCFSRKCCRIFFLGFRKVYRTLFPLHFEDDVGFQGSQDFCYVDFFDEEANKIITQFLESGNPCMISKFGTTELSHLVGMICFQKQRFSWSLIRNFLRYEIPSLNWDSGVSSLCTHSGFFPNDSSLMPRYFEENVNAIKQIDILGSYLKNESFFSEELKHCIRVNLDGYYAPFYYDKPWTRCLRGKKVLVIHPFAEDIRMQYQKRKFLWASPDVLPEFELITYKAVQSLLNMKTRYETWFDALEGMKKDISVIDFDIALIGCGAYGMPLAAHCKLLGKQAVHLAGWTQVLFGIKGKRWENNPRVSKMMNEYWVRPSDSNRPIGAEKIENACYW